MSYASKGIWIMGLDSTTNKYSPTYVKVSEYKKVTGLKTVIGFQTYDLCLTACQRRNVKELRP
jgi:hypothetical protein